MAGRVAPTYQLEWKDTISPKRMPSSNRKKTRRQVIARGLRERLAARQLPTAAQRLPFAPPLAVFLAQ
jgi:hypothetical protein